MVTEKQRANLAKGRAKGIKRKPTANKCDANNTFAGIFHFIESREITEQEWQTLALMGIYKADVERAGITDYRKLKKCVHIYADDSPAMVREYMNRSEPSDPLIMTLDVTKLSTDQLERIANGEEPRAVILAGAGGD